MSLDLRTSLKRLGKRLPAIAWRDEQMRVLRAYNGQLRTEIRKLGGVIPPAPSSVGPAQVLPQSIGRKVSLVRDSGLFDEAWYADQLDPREPRPDDLVRHYLTVGHAEGLSSTPAMAEEWYRSQLGGRAKDEPPLLHYLTSGFPGKASVHPSFPAAEYVAAHPESTDHPGGPLGHYLANGAAEPDETAEPTAWLPAQQFLARAREAALYVRRSRGLEHLPRQNATFDHEAEEQFKSDLLADGSLLADPPLVTVVLPTKDRSTPLRAAISSVQAQTYAAWELIVVDDGSTEDIGEVVAEYSFDPRITLVRHPVNRGVAAARNTAITRAAGSYIAYLDSDNTWHPDFLELMMRHIERTGAQVAYCATALVEQGGRGRRLYRGMPFSGPALRQRNYIDCIVVVHERALLNRTGGFDESLRRTVDWDLLIRLAEVTDFHYAPFIGSEYDLWEEATDRITTDVAEGYRFRVRGRTLVDWDAVRDGLDSRESHLSLVIAAMRPAEELLLVVDRLLSHTRSPMEIVVVDNHLPEGESVRLHTILASDPRVRLVRLPQRLTPELARNAGIAASTGRTLAFLHDRLWVSAGWDEPLVAALEDHAAVQPVVLSQTGAVLSAGVSFCADGRPHHAYSGFAGDAPELRGILEMDAISGAATVVKAQDAVAIEGFDPLYLRDELGPELSLRLREHTGRSVACIGTSHVALRKDPAGPRSSAAMEVELHNGQNLRSLWEGTGLPPLPEYARSGYHVEGFVRDPARRSSLSPILAHDRPGRPLRWAIKIGVYSVTDRESWGDWHFAHGLREALERLGHEVTIDTRDAWYRRTSVLDDVTLVLQGRGRFLPTPGQVGVVWVYSHPSEAPMRDLSEFDLVFGASNTWCERAKAFSRRPPEHLMQCTDPDRFFPQEADPALIHDVLMIGNARGVRPSVRTALQAGIVPSVYGRKWEGLLPPGAWRGDYVPNELVPTYYASAGAVLNDHWEEMRRWGLISNRLFDAAACGARLVSDHLPGIEEVFDDVVLTYTSPEDLRQAVDTHLHEDPDRAARRVSLAEKIRREHSFDARARTLSDRVQAVLAQRSSPSPVRETIHE